jgi:SAM-dependent methyltransferase
MHHATSVALAEFDRWSRSYDRSLLQRLFFQPSHELIVKHLRPRDQFILDIGCGTGLFAIRVLQDRPQTRVWGLDLSSKMLEQGTPRARFWPERLYRVRGDSGRLPFRDDVFDVVTCSHSFHHYPDQGSAVAEMFRVLKPGGRALIMVPIRSGATLEDPAVTDPAERERLYLQSDHVRLYGLEDLRERLAAQGFEVQVTFARQLVERAACEQMGLNPDEPIFDARKPLRAQEGR